MKTSFSIKLNLGNYQSAEFGVDDYDGDIQMAKTFVLTHIRSKTDCVLDKHAMKVFKK